MRTTILIFTFLCLSSVQLNAQWYEQNSGTTEILNSVFFIDEITGWACGSNGIIIKTTDGGTTWFSQNSNSTIYLTEIQFINQTTGWAVGYGNIILSTTDGGVDWNIITLDDSSQISAIHFVNNLVGWIAVYYSSSNSGKIFKSTNGGYNWNLQAEINSIISLEDIFFLDENNGWVSGFFEDGIYKTTDGGNIWTNYPNCCFGTQQELYFVSSQIGWICHNTLGSTALSKTTDGGITWNEQLIDYTKNIYSISFINENVGYAAGLNFFGNGGNIMQTTNGGTTWIEQYDGTQQLNSLCFINDFNGWAVGANGKIIHTINGGLPENQVAFSEDSIYIPTLSDSGSTKIVNSSDYPVRVDSIISVGSFYGYWGNFTKPGFQYPFYLFQTMPGFMGDTLGLIIPPHDSINVSFYDVDLCPICDYEIQDYFEDTLRFVFTFMNGNVYSFSKSIPISGEGHPSDVEDEEKLPKEFSLSQNYPNPFNPSTSIQYAIGSKEFVTLKIYDVLGNEVAVLVNEEKPSGRYEVEFKSSVGSHQLASEVYYYQLKAGDFIETKKMILIK